MSLKTLLLVKKLSINMEFPKIIGGAVITDMYPNTDPYTGNPLIVITTDKYVSYECNFFTIHTEVEGEGEEEGEVRRDGRPTLI